MDCKAILLIWALVATTWVQAAEPAAVPIMKSALLTIADGTVTVLRGRARFVATEGHRLEPMDIVQTDAATRVARLEFDDGTVLDLGPATQALLQPESVAWSKEQAVTAYIAQGWAKLRAPAGSSTAPAAGLTSATLDLVAPAGAVVLVRFDRKASFAFVEAGRAQLVEHVAAREVHAFDLGEGHAYTRADAADSGTASLRPAPAQLRETPPALADALPRRAREWATRAAPTWDEPQALAASDLALWLDTEPALQKVLRARFVKPTRSAIPTTLSAKARRNATNGTARRTRVASAIRPTAGIQARARVNP